MSNNFCRTHRSTLTGSTSPGQSGPGSNGNEGVLHISKALSLEPYHHQRILNHVRTLVGGGLTLLQRCTRCILQPQTTGWMHVCVCDCIYVCMYVCVYTFVCVSVCVYVCMFSCSPFFVEFKDLNPQN